MSGPWSDSPRAAGTAEAATAPGTVAVIDTALLARRLSAWAAGVQHLDVQVHPDWVERAGGGWAALWRSAGAEAGVAVHTPAHRLARHRLHRRLAALLCGGEPAPQALLSPLGRWCVLPPAELERHLMGLALALRPGVLRCCVHRPVRQALWSALGSAVEPLRALGAHAAAPPRDQLGWMPSQWACIGYGDLAQARLWPGRCLRRWVRLRLPCQLPRVAPGRRREAVVQAVAQVDAWLA